MTKPTVKQLAQQAANARREGRLSEARRDAEDAVNLCRQVGTEERLVRVLMLLGQIERDSDENEKARRHYEEAVRHSRMHDEPARFAHTVRHLADLYCEEGEIDLAKASYEEALAIYRRDQNTSPGDLANAIRGFAVMKDAAGATEEARSLWEEARCIYASLGVEEGVEECSTRLRS